MLDDYRALRTYVRTDSWTVTAKVSEDENDGEWQDAQVPEISAGGLSLLLKWDAQYKKDDQIWLKLHIDPTMPGLADLDIKVKVIVRSKRAQDESILFGVEFKNLERNDQIRLDELVQRAAATCQVAPQLDHLDT